MMCDLIIFPLSILIIPFLISDQIIGMLLCMITIFHGSFQQFPTIFEEVNMTAVSGISMNIEITCGFNENLGPELWFINGTIYDLCNDEIPCIQVDSLYSIRIKMVPLFFNDTTFQCLSSTIHPPGRVTRIFVVESKLLMSVIK